MSLSLRKTCYGVFMVYNEMRGGVDEFNMITGGKSQGGVKPKAGLICGSSQSNASLIK